MKKQLKEEKKRRKMMKKMAEAAKIFPTELTDNNVEEDSNAATTVPVAIQDMTLPASFDADNHTHRYRVLDSANKWLIRPVLDPHRMGPIMLVIRNKRGTLLARKEKITVYFLISYEDKLNDNKRGEGLCAEGAVIASSVMWLMGSSLKATLRDKEFSFVSIFVNYRLWIGMEILATCSGFRILVSCIWHHYLEIEESYVVYAAGLQPVDSQHRELALISNNIPNSAGARYGGELAPIFKKIGDKQTRSIPKVDISSLLQNASRAVSSRSISEEEIAGLKQMFEMIDADIGHIT
ncbi:translocase of chloroplast 120, chloroplastic-like protein [Tanacetum coccineum]